MALLGQDLRINKDEIHRKAREANSTNYSNTTEFKLPQESVNANCNQESGLNMKL